MGISLSLPIFEGGSHIAQVSKARAALNQTQADERSDRDSVILTLEQAWTDLQDAIDEVSVEKKFLQATLKSDSTQFYLEITPAKEGKVSPNRLFPRQR